MLNKKILAAAAFVLVAAIGFVFLSCGGGESGGGSSLSDDGTNFSIINNGNGAVTTIQPDPYGYSEPLEIVQTIPSLSTIGYYAKKKSVNDPSARQAMNTYSASSDSAGSFPANLPIMFFFNDKIYLNSIKDNVQIVVDGQKIHGTITINESAHGNAILTFVPWNEFKVNKTIAVTIKKGMQSQYGKGMYSDVDLIYQTAQGATGDFDGNGGFEAGMNGVVFIGDGSRMTTTGPLSPVEGTYFAAISSGDALVSPSGAAVGDTSSMMILGPINKDVSSVSFWYDFISAEFDDYVGSIYDDCAMFTISGPNGSYSEFITSVNTVGYTDGIISGNPFAGFPNMPDDGDDYAGHTGWGSRTINFANVGTPAYITFTVTDVSDQILSSILAIDKIEY